MTEPIIDLDRAPLDTELDRLFRREAPRLAGFFRRATRNPDIALDLVQDAFLRLAARSRAGDLSNPAAYLQRIARNMLADRHRQPPSPAIPLVDSDHSVAPDQEHALAADDLLRRYEQALAEMTSKTRAVFLLHRVDELTYRQIHLRLGISMATVEYHMGRALAHLDRALGQG